MPAVSPVISVLNDLLSACRTAEAAFREAAPRLRADELRTVLLNRAATLRELGDTLARTIGEQGGTPSLRGPGSVSQLVQRLLTSVRGSLDERSGDSAVLAACARVQANLLARFQSAGDHDLPPQVTNLLGRRLEDLQRDLDQLAALRDGTAVV